ncbi:hypothetical protein [Aeromicrobium sp. 9AM]|uniref:hypothetical protein n=1 Tax=Aeromicrobium sp. 9AM TaxID=2653126 RepID=UPI0012EEF95D|nr:hypothetical protein [Aeromicrobium sp. 9AM]VXB82812.1 conserved hypothetical protein [Aeromicrobium sp. 9AM]
MGSQDPRYMKRWRYDRSHGKLRLADATPARLHIATCLGQGMSLRAIAAAAGVSVQAVHTIHHGQVKARHATIAAIRAVQPGVTRENTPGTTEPFVPKVGAVRRIQALLALGWTHASMTEHTGIRTAVMMHQRGRWITLTTHEAIERMYDELSMTPGPSHLTRGRAARLGYVPPLGWDDIDNDEAPTVLDELPHTLRELDEVAVQRAMNGDRTVALTKPEREEIARRWEAQGRPLNELERVTGINAHRYRDKESA